MDRLEEIVARGRDGFGLEVILTRERMRHIVEGHPEMRDHELAIMTAVERADTTTDGNRPGHKVLVAEGIGPVGRELKVVVDYGQVPALVRTAHCR